MIIGSLGSEKQKQRALKSLATHSGTSFRYFLLFTHSYLGFHPVQTSPLYTKCILFIYNNGREVVLFSVELNRVESNSVFYIVRVESKG